jgi:hypothetical protein
VQAVIHFKWTSWARRFLLYELACYVLWLLAFTAFTLVVQHEDWNMGFRQMLVDRVGITATLLSLAALLPMAPFLYMEMCTIAAYGTGWVGVWNVSGTVPAVRVSACTEPCHKKLTLVTLAGQANCLHLLCAASRCTAWQALHAVCVCAPGTTDA